MALGTGERGSRMRVEPHEQNVARVLSRRGGVTWPLLGFCAVRAGRR